MHRKKKYSRYNKTRGRFSFESKEEYFRIQIKFETIAPKKKNTLDIIKHVEDFPSNQEKSIPHPRIQIKFETIGGECRGEASKARSETRSNHPFSPRFRFRSRLSSFAASERQKKKRKKETRVQLNGIPRRRQRNDSPFSSFSFIEKMRRDERWKWNPRFQSREQRFWKTRSKSSSIAAWDKKTSSFSLPLLFTRLRNFYYQI